MEQKPENLSLETEILKAQYAAWFDVLKNKDRVDTYHLFAVSRRDEPESNFTADEVTLWVSEKPFEEYKNQIPSDFKLADGEKWLHIVISPKNPYRKLAFFEIDGEVFYYEEDLAICLSNHGRAYQITNWSQVRLDIATEYPHFESPFLALKSYPKPQDLIRLDNDPEAERIIIEPFEPLNGQNLERLIFLIAQVQKGNVVHDYDDE